MPDPRCEACRGAGTVACWSPGGPCSMTVCDLCGPCHACKRGRRRTLLMVALLAVGAAALTGLGVALAEGGDLLAALAWVVAGLALAAAAGAESRDL